MSTTVVSVVQALSKVSIFCDRFLRPSVLPVARPNNVVVVAMLLWNRLRCIQIAAWRKRQDRKKVLFSDGFDHPTSGADVFGTIQFDASFHRGCVGVIHTARLAPHGCSTRIPPSSIATATETRGRDDELSIL
jgi:hypothetical protein